MISNVLQSREFYNCYYIGNIENGNDDWWSTLDVRIKNMDEEWKCV